jgi:23S rRNA pseudouridine2605 synthase
VRTARGVPLERALSKLGHATRSQARGLILSGRVAVNGSIVRDPLARVVPERCRFRIDGAHPRREPWTFLALNKPRGFLTTRVDPEGRPTVYDLLVGVDASVRALGRLDLASTGLLLFTNDTRLGHWLTDPANGVLRRYVVTVRGELGDEALDALVTGIGDRNEVLRATHVQIMKRSRRETHLMVALDEGKNREIRRMLGAMGHEVTRLKRVAFGGLELGDLAPGRFRQLTPEDVARAFPISPIAEFAVLPV